MRPWNVAIVAACLFVVGCPDTGGPKLSLGPQGPLTMPIDAKPVSDAGAPAPGEPDESWGNDDKKGPPPLVFRRERDHYKAHTVTSDVGFDLVATATRDDGVERTSDFVIGAHDVRRTEILGLEPLSLRIAFGDGALTTIHDGKEHRTPFPFAGKAYRVTFGDGGPAVTGDDGGPLPPKERALLTKAMAGHADAEREVDALVAAPAHMGERSPQFEALLRRAFSQGFDSVRFVDLRAGLSSIATVDGERCGVFHGHVKCAANLKGLTLLMDVEGDVAVRVVDAEIVRLDMRGRAGLRGEMQGVQLRGEGNAAFKAVMTSERP